MSYCKLTDNMNEVKVPLEYIGVPFVRDGTTLEGIDCAGLVCLFLKNNGVALPDDTLNYQDNLKQFIKRGKILEEKSDLQPLDIILFKYTQKEETFYHAGIYIGYGKFLQQNTCTKSGIGRLSGYWGTTFYKGVRPHDLIYNNVEVYNEIKGRRINFVATVAGIVAGWVAAALVGSSWAGLAATLTYVVVYAACAYGISAIANAVMPKPDFGSGGAAKGSPRYAFGPLQNTSSSELPVPILYGELKIAGNCIYQSDPDETIYRCDVLSEGEINSISEVKVNDIAIGELEGCSVTEYYGTSSQNVDSTLSSRVPGLRNNAYLALTLQTSDKLRGGFPAVTVLAEGIKVETWDGLKWVSTKTYSNNPAACIRDFITNVRYGIGMPKELLDEDSFGEVYDYSAVLVDDNENGTEARYALNYTVDSKRPAVDILSEMLSTCGGFLLWSGNRLKLRTEKVENVSQNFTMSNIIEGSFSYQYVPKDSMVNRVKLMYVDSAQNYTKVFALAEDKVNQDDRAAIEGGNGITERESALLGVTKFSRASRIANLYLKTSKATPLTCQFKAGIYAIHCEPGDIITVSHDVPNWTNKPFRIIAMEEEPNDEMLFTCKEYNDSVYDDSYGSSVSQYYYGTPSNYLKNDSEVSGVTLEEIGWRNEDGTHIANIDVTWAAPTILDYLTGYYVEWNKDGAGYEFAARADIGATYVRLPNAEVGSTYTVRVKSVNYYGIFSSGVASDALLVIGKDDLPPSVDNFIVNQFSNAILFQWDRITAVPDIHHYEIKQGASWAGGIVIGQLLRQTTYTYLNIQNGTWTYWIKAVDNSGNYSENAVSASLTISSVAYRNVLVESQQDPDWDNVVSNGSFEEWSGEGSGDWLSTTKLVANFNGTSGDTTYTADTGQVSTLYSDAKLDSVQKVFGDTSLGIPTVGDGTTFPDSADWAFASGDFTIDYRVKFKTLSTGDWEGQSKINQWTASKSWSFHIVKNDVSGDYAVGFDYEEGAGYLIDVWEIGNALVVDTWYHVAATRKDLTTRVFLDGKLLGTGNYDAVGIADIATHLNIQADYSTCWIDSLRILKGKAAWTSDFTPPTTEYEKDNWYAPDDWTFTGASGVIARDSNTTKISDYSAKITRNGTDCLLYNDFSATKGIDWWKGKEVKQACWVYASSGDCARLYLGDNIGSDTSSFHTGNSTWQLLTVTRVIPSGATYERVGVQVADGDTSAYFDGVMLKETGDFKNLYWGTQSNLYISSGYLSGDYWTDWIDVGEEVTAKVGIYTTASVSGDTAWDSSATVAFNDSSSLGFDGHQVTGTVQNYIQTSGDSGVSGDLVPWQYADYNFKAIRVKSVFTREETDLDSTTSAMNVSIDVPDVDEYGPTNGTYRYCPASGDNVTLSKVFYRQPSVAIMVYPSGDGKLRTPEVTANTTTFNVVLRDKDNTAIEGNYRYHVHGFVWVIAMLLPSLFISILSI